MGIASLTIAPYWLPGLKQQEKQYRESNKAFVPGRGEEDENDFLKPKLREGTLKAYLHGTTLSHATSLRQAYDMT